MKLAALNDVACALRSFASAPGTAHTVAHKHPGCIAGELPGTVIVLVFLADAANVRFSC